MFTNNLIITNYGQYYVEAVEVEVTTIIEV
jgi:hypothetical protein